MPKYPKLIPKRDAVQDATAPKNIYRTNPSSPRAPSNTRGSFTGSLVKASRKALPINVSMFTQDLTGNKLPLTEKDLKVDEVDVLRKAARNAQAKKVTQKDYQGNPLNRQELNYDNYSQVNGKVTQDPSTFDDLKEAVTNPVRKMGTTIGGAMLKPNGAKTTLTDSFDFGGEDRRAFEDQGKPSTVTALKNIGKSLLSTKKEKYQGFGDEIYDNLRALEGNLGSNEDGKGIPVNIDLGNLKRPTKTEEEYKMGTKKIKVKKAASGLQSIAVPEQGDMSNVLSSTASMTATGAQFGPWGAAAGAVGGLTMGLIQKNKQDAEHNDAVRRNRYLTANRAVAGTDESVDQKTQRFSRGTKAAPTKTIEIEGKKTPEIHTDKNFNVKNLGTTPHSKGGNKVQAEEGDIVFNTQNSLAKYNKIANAIKTGDKSTLNKEKNKLPEDNSNMKNQSGNKGLRPLTAKEKRAQDSTQAIGPAKGIGMTPTPKTYKVRTAPSSSAKRPKYESANDYIKKSDAKQDQLLGSLTGGVSSFKDAPGERKMDKTGNFYKVGSKGEIYYQNGRMKGADGKMSNIPVKKEVSDPNSFGNRLSSGVASNVSGTFGTVANATKRFVDFQSEGWTGKRPFGTKSDNEPSTPTTPSKASGYTLPSSLGGRFNTQNPLAIPGISNPKTSIPVASTNPNKVSAGKQGKRISGGTVAAKTHGEAIAPADWSPRENEWRKLKLPDSSLPTKLPTISASSINAAKTTPDTTTTNTVPTAASKFSQGSNTALQLTGVANNLFQGLKSEKPISQSYLDPEKITYKDRSESLRQQSNSAAAIQSANARNVSGGLGSNIRANQNQAALSNLGRQNAIDSNEIQRRDAIDNQNVAMSNQAKQVNLGRKDMYQQQLDGTRAAKQAYIDQASSDLGQLGMARQEENYMRSRDDKAYRAQAAGLKSINSMTPDFETDEDGNRTFIKNKVPKAKKGMKSVSLSKYKMKK